MAFGKVDHVNNHITGERKQITTIDIDKEFGKKGLPKVKFDKDDYNKSLLEYKESCITTILSIDPSWGSRDYSNYIIIGDKLSWNSNMLRELPTSQLGTIRAHLERIKETNINPINNL